MPSLWAMYAQRLDRVRSAMSEHGVDVLLVSVGAGTPKNLVPFRSIEASGRAARLARSPRADAPYLESIWLPGDQPPI